MNELSQWLDDLAVGTEDAEAAEAAFRAELARRIKALAEARAFAFRKLNLMRAICDAVSSAGDEETAVANGLAVLRTRLGWAADSEARAEIISRFAPVCVAAFARLGEDGIAPKEEPASALAAFEEWYATARGSPFWILFETYMPETPLVDF